MERRDVANEAIRYSAYAHSMSTMTEEPMRRFAATSRQTIPARIAGDFRVSDLAVRRNWLYRRLAEFWCDHFSSVQCGDTLLLPTCVYLYGLPANRIQPLAP